LPLRIEKARPKSRNSGPALPWMQTILQAAILHPEQDAHSS